MSQIERVGDALPHLQAGASVVVTATMAIGSPITGAIDGGILYVGAGAILAEDAALFWDDTDNQLVLAAGTVAKPSLILGDDATGFWRPAADVIGISRAGVDVFRLGGTGPDSDQIMTFGRFLFDSRAGLSDRAVMSHRDQSAVGAYAWNQTAAGFSVYNALAGQLVVMGIGGASKWSVDASSSVWLPQTDIALDIGMTATRTRRIIIGDYIEISEMTAPANAPTDKARLFCRDNGSGKTQLVAIFPTGAVVVIATEP